DLAADGWDSGGSTRCRRGTDVFAPLESLPGPHLALCAGGGKRPRNRLCHVFVRPRPGLRRTAGGTGPRKSIACSSLRGAPKLGLFPHWLERGTSGALNFHGNKNASAFAAHGEWGCRGQRRNAGGARGPAHAEP